MTACKPAAVCTLIMPSGKRCGGMALRNQRFCWAHIRTHRALERERILGSTLERLGDKIAAMDTGELLNFLHQQLGRLQKTLRRYPAVGYTVTVTLDRITEITRMESETKRQMQQNHELLNKIREVQMNSLIYSQSARNQAVKANSTF